MVYEKTWTFNLNQTPALQDTVQHQCQSFISFLQSNLVSVGWAVLGYPITTTPTPQAIGYHTGALLSDGRVLISGGIPNVGSAQSATYLGTISGTTVTWATGTALPQGLYSHQTTLLPDGRILVTGGANASSVNQNTTYFGTFSGNSITWVAGTVLPQALSVHQTTLLPDGRIVVTGGTNGAYSSTVYIGTISGNSIAWVTSNALPQAVYSHQTTLLADGRLLVTGGYNSGGAQATTYLGTVSGNTITWVSGTALPRTLYEHAVSLLPDGRILTTGGSPGITNTYFGTISGNTITWANGSPLVSPLILHTSTVLSDGRILIAAGYNAGYVATTYIAAIPNLSTTIAYNLATDSVGLSNSSTIQWNTNTGPRSWVLLASPVGIVPGPDGSYTGSQSQVYLCIECVGATSADYSKVNLTFYSSLPVGGSFVSIPTGGNGQSIAVAGTTFINSTLTAYRFHFAHTASGGFYAGVSTVGNGIMPTILGFIDLADIQPYGSNLYPYPIVGFLYYNNIAGNMTYNIFDSVGNAAGVKCFNYDGTAGTPRAMVLCSPTAGIQLPGTGTTGTGDINGNILDSPIHMYNIAAGKIASMGRIPDFKATGASSLTNSWVDNAAAPNYTYINQLLIPAYPPIAV